MAQGTAITTSVPDEPDLPDDLPPDDLAPELNGTDPLIEARARRMGWRPLEEFRGDHSKWRPAAEYLERGETMLPIVQKQNRDLTERLGKLEGEVTGLRSTASEQLQIIKDLRDMGQRANQAGYDRAMAEIKARQRAAVEQGDTKAYDQLVEQAEALAGSRERTNGATPPVTAEPVPPAPPQRPPVSAAVQEFVNQNAWFNTNAFLTRKMIDQHVDVIQEGQIVDEAEQLAEAKQRLMEMYPDRFDTPPARREPAPRPAARPRRAAVAQPTPEPPAPRNSGAATSINSIADPAERAEARAAFNRVKRQLPDYTEAEYMALYADPHGDVLVMQQKPRRQADGR